MTLDISKFNTNDFLVIYNGNTITGNVRKRRTITEEINSFLASLNLQPETKIYIDFMEFCFFLEKKIELWLDKKNNLIDKKVEKEVNDIYYHLKSLSIIVEQIRPCIKNHHKEGNKLTSEEFALLLGDIRSLSKLV